MARRRRMPGTTCLGLVMVLVLALPGCGTENEVAGGLAGPATAARDRGGAGFTGSPTDLAPAVPADAYASPAGGATAVDLPTAERVFRALYPLRSEAIYHHRADVIQAIEIGSALEYDLAQCRANCEEPEPVGPDIPHTFSAPPQSGYPAYFFAQAPRTLVDGVRANEIVVFSRVSEKEPWRIALNNAYGETLPVFEAGHAAFGRAVAPLLGPDPAALPRLWASFLQHWFDHGTAPADHPFYVAEYVQERLNRIVEQPARLAARGQQEARSYTAEPSTFVASADKGRIEVCGAVRLEQHISPAPGQGPFVQPANRREFGASVAPGKYREIVIRGIEEDCFLISGDGRPLPTFSPNVDISVTGTPI